MTFQPPLNGTTTTITNEYLRADMAADQTTNLGNGHHVMFDTLSASSGSSISLDTTTTYTSSSGASRGRFTLAANKTYVLRSTIPRVLFTDAVSNLHYRWYNVTAGAEIGSKAGVLPITWSATPVANNPYAEAVITPGVSTLVEVRFTQSTTPTTIGGNDMMPSALIEVISSTTVNVSGSGGAATVFNVSTKTSNYTLTAADTMVLADCTSGNVTITLPLASTLRGYRFYVKRIDASANDVIVTRSGSDSIDGKTSELIDVRYNALGFVSNGSNWYII